jgi:hypothetical protein
MPSIITRSACHNGRLIRIELAKIDAEKIWRPATLRADLGEVGANRGCDLRLGHRSGE